MHSIRLIVADDGRRTRLTVFFRLILAIPHLLWLGVWGFAAIFVIVAGWFAALVKGRLPTGIHEFLSRYARYTVHVYAYTYLLADPFPPFSGEHGGYPVDLDVAPPQPQNRWRIAFRLVLALPAVLLAAALSGGGPNSGNLRGGGATVTTLSLGLGLLTLIGLLGWWAALFTTRMPRGLRDAGLFSLQYATQAWAYVILLTDRYPDADPEHLHVLEGAHEPDLTRPEAPLATVATVVPAPDHPVTLDSEDDLRRSRLLVLFRLPLAAPHIVWVLLWGVLAALTSIAMWVVTLIRGTPPAALHRFIAAYVRYATHVDAFILSAANAFPGFTGAPGTYPVQLTVGGRGEQQNRWTVLGRAVLAVPALLVYSTLGGVVYLAAFFGWWVALFTGRMPRGLRNLIAWYLRYAGQSIAYLYMLTGRYPYAGPPA